ncbi:POT family MFS transporter [Anaerobaca lacustris]|uniref:POT family MFS transporter n=1 Tax=Anaerobaca lacustris TaxID=3044600 RepID=A0AAW6U2R2_9BACT|nr:POT family MFS transporter [Sedimentisphaerales bacterium M17dextr]
MAKREYLTAPLPSAKMPAGIPYILTNEAAERFAFYGMSSILVVFMTKYLMGSDGVLSVMGDEQAKKWFHLFTAAVYFTPLLGALLSDVWLGKYRTIVVFSVVYCVGFAAMAWDHTRVGLGLGLILIALGSGVIKPCVSANVGDQFGQSNKHLISKMYSWFYFSINLGACISMLACPWLLDKYGPGVGFGVPAALMVFATVAFVAGKWKYVHIPPAGERIVREVFEKETLKILARLCVIFVFVSMFFALFYQSQSAWVLQAEKMNLRWLGVNWLPAQVQFVNSFYIILMIPLFAYVIYPALHRVFPLTPLRKIGIGMFVTALCFVVPAWVEIEIAKGASPSIGWQFFAYVLLTAGEILASIPVLEFAYTQAPKKLKTFVMSLYLLAISLGNVFSALVNHFIQNEDGSSKLPGASYYWFFAGAMLVTLVLYIPVAMLYPVKEYIQDEKA